MSLCPHTGCNYPEGDCTGACMPEAFTAADRREAGQSRAIQSLQKRVLEQGYGLREARNDIAQLRADLREERRQRRRANGWTWVALGLLAAETLLHNVAYYLLG